MYTSHLIKKYHQTKNMKTAKVDKFNWSKTSDVNLGHTSNEWGIRKKKSNVIISYDVKWNV